MAVDAVPSVATDARAEGGEHRASPHVLLLSYTFQPEPGVVRGLPLARALRDRGYRVTVLTAFPQYPLGRVYDGYTMRWRTWETMHGIPVLRVPIYPSHDRSALKRVATYLSFMVTSRLIGARRIGPVDLVYHSDNLPSTATVAWQIAARHGGASIQHIADLWPDSVLHSEMLRGRVRSGVERVLHRWCQWVYERDDAITVLSPGFKRILVERGVPEAKVHVIYNWADEELFFPTTPDESLRRSIGIDGGFTFLYAGNLGPLQGLETVIEAAARVRDIPQVRVVLMGTGPAEAGLRELARRLDARNVTFVGRRPVEEMNAVNALGDVFLVSLRDLEVMRATIPSKVQVGLASGRPILAALAGDGAALLEAAGAGIAVPPGDAAALAAAMRRFASLGANELRAMGERGRQYYDAHLSLAAGVERTDAVFQAVLAEVHARRANRAA